ncbi:MAG: low molecular weight phosphotyrosine protein phosphatase [Sandaracinaceae bacterium]|nr:low molecular weight phosphotyrosine protein phosphatase [Sandaracinaceae bacterium]MBK7775709.1 low molecular weight phosphotyrosine protein phosphatase [Sandaracinaceae bacterium]MBP7682104.1 low molecular weight phosphotyrosine protein phosphatase [Deltaproteobacteria bacterium]
MIRVCFVCLGNICRSPTAHGVMENLVRERRLEDVISVAGAGTGAWHVGARPDRRAEETARRRGFSLPGVAEHFTAADFDRFDRVLAMDRSNLESLQRLARDDEDRAKIALFRAFDPLAAPGDDEVPDPYYGGPEGFELVFDMCERTCAALLTDLLRSSPKG